MGAIRSAYTTPQLLRPKQFKTKQKTQTYFKIKYFTWFCFHVDQYYTIQDQSNTIQDMG